jgi:hypothetical protein
MQCVNLTDDELWQAIAHNTTAMSALVYRRLELDAGNTRNDVIDRAQLMQSNLETISKLERKYREYTDELRRRYPAPGVIAVTEVEETRQVSRTGQRDCAAMREGRGDNECAEEPLRLAKAAHAVCLWLAGLGRQARNAVSTKTKSRCLGASVPPALLQRILDFWFQAS